MQHRARLGRLGTLIPLLIVLAAVAAPPWSLRDKAHWVGFAVCHQIAERSFQPGGVPLPLCARCTGTFLGGLVGFAAIAAMRRLRYAAMPPARVLLALLLGALFWAVDGLNSYLSFFPGLPRLYTPSNALRLITGMFLGIALSVILQPITGFTLWRNPVRLRAVDGLRTLGAILLAAAALALVVNAEWAFTLYPLTALSVLGVLWMLTVINALILAILSRRENTFERWAEIAPLALWGLALTIMEIGVVGLLRTWLMRLEPTLL